MFARWFAILGLFSFLTSYVGSAAPIPKKDDSASPPFKFVWAMLGKNHTGKEVRAFGRILKEDPVIRYSLWSLESDKFEEDDLFFLIWKTKGIAMNVREKMGVTLVNLYNDCPEGYRRYRGELPSQLTFDDHWEAVQEKLGKPEHVTELPARGIKGSDQELEEAWLDYPKKGLRVLLRRPKGGKWTVFSLMVKLPRE